MDLEQIKKILNKKESGSIFNVPVSFSFAMCWWFLNIQNK
jgi:hypothetical protein